MKQHSFLDKLRIGLTTIKNVVISPIDATEKVSDEIYSNRLETCKNCPNLQAGKCALCGCPVFDKAQYIRDFTKDDLPIMACPQGRWAQ